MIKITVIGGGRVGLPVAAGFAEVGHQVVCCESDRAKRELAASGKAPFVDKGLDLVLAAGLASGNLRFCADIAESVAEADVVFIAVPFENGEEGMNLLRKVAAESAASAPLGCVLAIKSTVPPGTCEQLEYELGNNILVVSNPEFLRQGIGLRDFLNSSRIVVGADDAKAAQLLQNVYKPIVARGAQYIETSRISAEMSKLAANMFLSSRVTLINELANLCEETGSCINEVIEVISADKRIGRKYLHPGTGFGGACLPKDGQLLMEAAKNCNVDMPAVEAIYESNNTRAKRLAERMLAFMPPRPVVAAWGVAFKPDSDDARTSPAIAVIRALCARGAKVRACDVGAISNVPENMPSGYKFFGDCFESLVGADMLVVLVCHQKYTQVSPEEIRRRMKGAYVFDCAGALDRKKFTEAGLICNVIGRRQEEIKKYNNAGVKCG